MAVNPEQIYNKQMSLAQQLRLAQQAQAQAQYNQGHRALAEQLRANRMGMQQSRSALQDQAFMTNRAIQQGTQARGLGNSGLKDAALIQSQLAQGKNINQLEQQNSEVQRAALSTRLGLSDSLVSGARAIDAQYTGSVLDAEREKFDRQQGQQENLLRIYEMSKSGATSSELQDMAKILGVDLNTIDSGFADMMREQEQYGALQTITADTPHFMKQLLSQLPTSARVYRSPKDKITIVYDGKAFTNYIEAMNYINKKNPRG